MTITSRRLAHRCRERLATDPGTLSDPADLFLDEPPTTVDCTNAMAEAQLERVDATK